MSRAVVVERRSTARSDTFKNTTSYLPWLAIRGRAGREAAKFTRTCTGCAIFAFAMMATLPVLLLLVLFQKGFIRSVAAAGIKG